MASGDDKRQSGRAGSIADVVEFSARTRSAAIDRMTDGPLDVLVVGGGATGCGVALDAAARGFRTALVERDDFASGTSGRSSRLIHGGIRYLSKGDVGVVYGSLRERQTLLRLAPHLVTPLPFFVVAPRGRARVLVRAGLVMYEALAAGRGIGRHRAVPEAESGRYAPGLARASRGYVYPDCRTDDARLTLEVARAAAAKGASLANHVAAVSVGAGAGGFEVDIADSMEGEHRTVRARAVVNAGGVWAHEVHALAGPSDVRLQPSKGVHLVFRAADLPVRAATLFPSGAHDRAFVFAIPWGPRVYVGTTDSPYQGSLDEPGLDDPDADYLLAAVNGAFGCSLARSDVTAWWAGLRPLLARGDASTRDLSRRHVVIEDPPGFLTVTGGKLTAYRAMSQDVTNRLAKLFGSRARSTTRSIPLGFTGDLTAALGAGEYEGAEAGLAPEAGRRLVRRYGDDWGEALDRIRSDPALGEPLVEGLPVLRVEASLARDREMALTDDDVLIRRTRLATMDARATELVKGRS